MSSDDYFEDDQIDSAFLAEVDAIEAAHSQVPPPSAPVSTHPSTPLSAPSISSNHASSSSNISTLDSHKSTSKLASPLQLQVASKQVPAPIDVDADESYDAFFDDIDPSELARLDKDVEHAYKHGHSATHAGAASGYGATRQLTLFGDPVAPPAPRPQRSSQQQGQSKPIHQPRNPFGQKARKTKKWDHTAFAKSGWKSSKNAQGNGKGKKEELEGEDELREEFEQFPAPIPEKYSFGPPPALKLGPDLLAAQSWIFPTNQSKRDYQFNIIRESLFENCLVSLPTGLGKTFIAGVVMLNYYRWFPEGKVVFVAPTKPLVAQQIEACHKTCGIPGGDAAELTGQNPKPMRAKAWAEKRVFYMTPQTFMNDLKSDTCDPTSIILLVIDEAHKATGDYAYAQVVRYLMAKNAHFRILALTATPGSNAKAVQTIVDSLHISHIEIRDENSIDLRGYMQPKKVSTHIVKMTEDIIIVRDLMAKLMEKIALPLLKEGILDYVNPVTLHPYRCNRELEGLSKRKNLFWAYGPLQNLGSLARAMGYLYECSAAMCHQALQELSTDGDETGKKSSKSQKNLRSDPLFKDLIKVTEQQHNAGLMLHPKMDKLQSIAVDYFAQAGDADEATGDLGGETKMMVFTNFRSSVDEIVKVLNAHDPMIRATRFIGQGTDKQGRKGIAQKEQLEVIKDFKEGKYNVLVATSIGEEGLDIGEVDMIICYDAQKTPIRMLQRVGRTGRKRAGRVEVLLSEAREEANWDRAKGSYETVQTAIIRGESLELFGDVDRLLPVDIKPRCIESHMAIEEYVRDIKPSRAQRAPTKGTKRKRNDDIARNIPEGAMTGFVSSAKLISKGGSKKRKITAQEYDPDDVSDDGDDLAIQAGLRGPTVVTTKDKGKGKGKGKGKSKPSTKVPKKNAGSSTARSKKAARSKSPEVTLSQLMREGEDDTDDMEIERGIRGVLPVRPLAPTESSRIQSFGSPSGSAIIISSSPERPLASAKANSAHVFSISTPPRDHSWLLDSDDDVQVISPHFKASSKVDSNRAFEMVPPCSEGEERNLTPPKKSLNFRRSPLSHVTREKVRGTQTQVNMLPPPVPAHAFMSSDVSPELSQPIRPLGARRKRLRAVSVSSSPGPSNNAQYSSPAPSPPRPPPQKKQRRREFIDPSRARQWYDVEAEVSGDDVSSGSSDTDGVESESDRRFVEELAATQASPSYDQTAAYRNSLCTQAPGGGPRFATKPVRRGAFGTGRQQSTVNLSSSPKVDEAPDQYSMDSFVVEDDDDILAVDHSRSSDY